MILKKLEEHWQLQFFGRVPIKSTYDVEKNGDHPIAEENLYLLQLALWVTVK